MEEEQEQEGVVECGRKRGAKQERTLSTHTSSSTRQRDSGQVVAQAVLGFAKAIREDHLRAVHPHAVRSVAAPAEVRVEGSGARHLRTREEEGHAPGVAQVTVLFAGDVEHPQRVAAAAAAAAAAARRALTRSWTRACRPRSGRDAWQRPQRVRKRWTRPHSRLRLPERRRR